VREAYGRPENMRPMSRTYVIWHTRNTDKFLEDPTGNRRFIPMPLYDYIDEDWLRMNREQLWAEIIELEERARWGYFKEMEEKNISLKDGEEKFTDIFLPPEHFDALAELCQRHMKDGISLSPSLFYERLLKDLINQPFVLKTATQVRVLGDDVRKYLRVSEGDWKATESVKVTKILENLGWEKKQIWIKGKNGEKDEVKQGYRYKGMSRD
jgi:hypothetical protein